MHAWKELAATPDGLEAWVRGPLDCLATGEIDLVELVRGDTLLHNDIRSDNLLLTPDGNVVLVDWGQTCQGASWLDLVMFALTANFEGGADADLLVREHPLTRAVPHRIIDGILVASFAAYR